MKNAWVVAVVLGLGCWGARAGEEAEKGARRERPGQGDQERPGKGEIAGRIFERADKDGDGALSKEEFHAALEALRKMHGERQGERDGEGGPGRGEMRGKLLERFDKDGDGKLSEDEKEAAKLAMQNRRDRGEGGKPRP